jgi:hypothetical protein
LELQHTCLFCRDIFEQFEDDFVGGFAFGIGLEGANQPMAKDQGRESGDILTGDIETAQASGAGAPGED